MNHLVISDNGATRLPVLLPLEENLAHGGGCDLLPVRILLPGLLVGH